MSFRYTAIIISLLLGLLCLKFLRKQALYEKKTTLRIIILFFWGGILSLIITDLLYSIADISFGIKDVENILGAFLVVGPIEESAKLFGLMSGYFIYRKEFNEPKDGLIYMGCVAIGFSIAENYFYSIHKTGNEYLIIARLFIATPAHFAFSAICGLAFYIYKKYNGSFRVVIFSLMFAIFLHGLWDAIFFSAPIVYFFIIAFVCYLGQLSALLSYTTAISPFRLSLIEFVENYKNAGFEKGLYCVNCGSENDKLTYKVEVFKFVFFMRFQKCNNCHCYVIQRDDLYYLHKYFSPEHFQIDFRPSNIFNILLGRSERILKKLLEIYGRNKIEPRYNNINFKETGVVAFDLEELSHNLESIRQNIINGVEKMWFVKKLLYYSRIKTLQLESM